MNFQKIDQEGLRMTYQLTAPLLDACVLGIVAENDAYGYTLTQKVQEVVDISESTLYPVLRRLQKSGHLRRICGHFQSPPWIPGFALVASDGSTFGSIPSAKFSV